MDCAALFGIGFGTEAPMVRPLAMRVDGITNGILAAIKVWEQTIYSPSENDFDTCQSEQL